MFLMNGTNLNLARGAPLWMSLLPFIEMWGWGLQMHGIESNGKPVSDICNAEMYALLQ